MRKLPQPASINLRASLGVTTANKISHEYYLLLPPPINIDLLINQNSGDHASVTGVSQSSPG